VSYAFKMSLDLEASERTPAYFVLVRDCFGGWAAVFTEYKLVEDQHNLNV